MQKPNMITAMLLAILASTAISAQVDLKIKVPKKTTEIKVMHGDTCVALTPRFRKVIIKNIEEKCTIKMLPGGEVLIFQPKENQDD